MKWSKAVTWSSPGRSFPWVQFPSSPAGALLYDSQRSSKPQRQQINLTCWVCSWDPVWFLCPRIFFLKKKKVSAKLFTSVLDLHFVLSDVSAVACLQFGFIWSSFSLWILLICNFPLFYVFACSSRISAEFPRVLRSTPAYPSSSPPQSKTRILA